MSTTELLKNIEYITDQEGHSKAIIDLSTLDRFLIIMRDSKAGEWVYLSENGTFERVPPDLKESLNQLNRETALNLLRDWMVEPDDKGDAWWDEFEADLKRNRLTFREVDLSDLDSRNR